MESEFGAPVFEAETAIIDRQLDTIKKYLPKRNVEEIVKKGFSEIKDGELLIRSIDNRDCVFSYYEGTVAKCGIEKAYFDGKVDFRKPISCHLFPIRISDFGGPVLRYEKYDDCLPAVKRGANTGLTVAEFCKDALIRAFGTEWYDELMNNPES